MNKVYYSLTAGLLAFAGWFVADLNLQLMLVLWLSVTILILGAFKQLINLLNHIETTAHGRRLQRSEHSTVLFAPIDNAIAASLAQQISPTMTLTQIDRLVGRVSYDDPEIHHRQLQTFAQ